MNRFYLLALTITVLSSCSHHSQKEEQNLYTNMKAPATIADSVITGKQLPLNVQNFDSTFIPPQWKLRIAAKHIPLLVNNVIGHEGTDTCKYTLNTQTITLKSISKKINPFISFAQDPKPVKAGELRSTGLSNSDITFLSEEQGLPSSQIRCMEEDPQGFFWIGQSAGLTKYDGYNFYTYNTKSGLPSNSIQKIVINKDSTLWIATNNGLVYFDGRIFKIYNTECGLPGNNIVDITLDKNGDPWFICLEAGLCKLKNNQVKIYEGNSGLKIESLYKICMDGDGRIVLGHWGNLPTLIENENTSIQYLHEWRKDQQGKQYETSLRFGSNVTTALFKDKNNDLWFGSYSGGVALFKKDLTIKYKPNTGMPYFLFSAVFEDSNGKIWMGSGEGGVAQMDSKGFVCYTTKQGLTSNKVMCMMEDSQKNIWIGTQDGGLNRIRPSSFKIYSSTDGLTDKPIISFAQNKKGEVLIGSWGGGIYAFDGKKFDHYSGHGIILNMKENSKGELFTAVHQFGIDMLKPCKNDSVSYDSSYHLSVIKKFESRYSYGMYVDKNDDVWFANIDESGLMNYRYSSFSRYTKKEGLATGKVNNVIGNKRGDLWVSNVAAGISKISGNKITHFTKESGLPSNDVNTIYVDKHNRLLIGTNAGLCIYNDTSFINIDSKDGLSSNNINSIIEDDKGRLWIGTSRGLNLLTPSEFGVKGFLFERFFLNDGLKTNYFAINAVLLDKSGTLWWGTSKGAITLNLHDFNLERASPPCHLQQLGLMDEYVNFATLKDSLEKGRPYFNSDSTIQYSNVKFTSILPFCNLPSELSLPYNINTVNFNFFAFKGYSSHQIKYRYRLVGQNDNWINVNYPEVKFSNLDAGYYTFEAQAKLEGKEWGNACRYDFEIRPPFWKTWWFRVLSLSLIIYGIILIFRYRNKQLLERQEQLEITVKQRTSEIEHQKHLIEEKQKEIVDSINYAKRIQYALLAHEDILKQNLSDHFIFFNPKDIVSGDFYWSTKKDDRFYLALCDSTGHGVPGAFMSLLNIGFLTEAITEKGIEKPNDVFDYVRQKLIDNISKEGQKDGFDGILLCLDRKNKKLTYAAANNKPVLVSNNKVDEKAGDRMPVGVGERKESFKLFELDVKENDILYLYSDGFADQFGGPKGKKFKYGQLNQLLLDISQKQLHVQKQILQDTFSNWKGALEQVDDVCIIGLRV